MGRALPPLSTLKTMNLKVRKLLLDAQASHPNATNQELAAIVAKQWEHSEQFTLTSWVDETGQRTGPPTREQRVEIILKFLQKT